MSGKGSARGHFTAADTGAGLVNGAAWRRPRRAHAPMAYTDINSEDRLVQATFAEHLENELGWESVYAWNQETFGPDGTLGAVPCARA